MSTLLWIIASTLIISIIAFVGLITLSLKEKTLERITFLLVSFAAGSLISGGFIHLLPEAIAKMGTGLDVFVWLLAGFLVFFVMEQILHWHHCHIVPDDSREPVTYLILLADGLHNFIGGLAIGSSFLISIPVGIVTWIAAITHEIPQEFGDFGILIHGGWSKRKALLFNFGSALTVVLGGLIAFFLSANIDIGFLLPFAAGNFIYIAAADLIPEFKHAENAGDRIKYTLAMILGVLLVILVRIIFII